MAAELNALRDQIDDVDKQMLELLAKRLSLVEQVGEVKSDMAYPSMPRIEKQPCWPLAVKKRRKRVCLLN